MLHSPRAPRPNRLQEPGLPRAPPARVDDSLFHLIPRSDDTDRARLRRAAVSPRLVPSRPRGTRARAATDIDITMTTIQSTQTTQSAQASQAAQAAHAAIPRTTLNHMSLPTHDVAGTVDFLVRYLDVKTLPFGTSCVVKKDGWDIVIEDAGDRDVAWPGNFHIGMELATRVELEQMYAAMLADAVPIQTPLFVHVRGSRFFCWMPGEVLLEVNTREDAQPQYKATFASQQG
jgi:hypothetical protein